jgi:hypothetical protein
LIRINSALSGARRAHVSGFAVPEHPGSAAISTSSVSLECLHLCREGSSEFIESPLRAVLLRDCFPHVRGGASESHCRHVNGGHLSRKHGLQLVLRFHPFDHCQQEIDSALVHVTALRPNIGKLPEKPIQEIWI